MPTNILLVDDSAAIRKILCRVLQHAELDYGDVFEASDGLEALNVLKSQRVDLILTDINMPNMDGLQLLREVRSNDSWKKLPVVMITTEGAQRKVLEAVELGASDYVRKPFSAQEMKEKLTEVMRRSA